MIALGLTAVGMRAARLATVIACLGCAPELVVGTWKCGGGSSGADAVIPAASTELVELPWETSFEDGFCGYAKAGGFCYANPEASYEVTRSPVRSGRHAAAFHVTADLAPEGLQARCARQGILPEAAYYGAWVYIPKAVTSTDNWNLFHFDGNGADVHHDLWDVSLAVGPGGELSAYVFDFLRMMRWPGDGAAEVPVGEWFHLEVYWQRALDATGSFELYVDGVEVLSLTDLITDDAEGAEWHVGNLSTVPEPRPSTLYVDDVSISATRRGGN